MANIEFTKVVSFKFYKYYTTKFNDIQNRHYNFLRTYNILGDYLWKKKI